MRSQALNPAPDYWNPWHGGQSGLIYLAMLGAGVRGVSRTAAEDLRRARRPRGATRCRRQRDRAWRVYAMVPVMMGMIARLQFPDLEVAAARPPHAPAARRPAVGRRHRARGRVLGGAERRRRGPVHADDVAVAGFLQALREPGAEDGQVLRVTRITAVFAGALGVIVAIIADDVVDALSIFYTLMAVGLFVPILAGLFTRSPSPSRRACRDRRRRARRGRAAGVPPRAPASRASRRRCWGCSARSARIVRGGGRSWQELGVGRAGARS